MKYVDQLKEDSRFTLYEDTSKIQYGFTEMIMQVLWKSTRKNQDTILVVQHTKYEDWLLIYLCGDLLNAVYDFEYEILHPEIEIPVTVSPEYINSTYTIIGHWNS